MSGVDAVMAALPEGLPVGLREAVGRLVEECGLAVRPFHPNPTTAGTGFRPGRCYRCRKPGGPMGGHHLPDGQVVRVHRSCHRKIHRAARGARP